MSDDKWRYLVLKSGDRVKVDEEDYARVSKYTWRVRKRPNSTKLTVVTSVREGSKVKTISLGRFLMNPPPGKMVYPRRYENGLDFRKSNLIVCSVKERQRMLPKSKKGTSSVFRGVSYIQNKRKWRAGIEVDGKAINLGEFDDEIEAAKAYNRAAVRYFGEFAYQNQIQRYLNRRKAS